MLMAERRRRILEQVRSQGHASYRDLAVALGTSESTVRRDLRAIIGEGLLLPVRGGAGVRQLADPQAATPPAADDPVGAQRAAIAARAAQLVTPGSAVLLGPGRTTYQLARRLDGRGPLTVVTNSVLVTAALAGSPEIDVVSLGGTLRRSIQAFVGPITEANLQDLRGSQVFISGDGVTIDRGLTTPNVFAAATDQALVAAGRQVIVLADHTKIGKDTMCQTVPCSRMDVLVTDSAADPAMVRRFLDVGVDVQVVAVDDEK